MQCSADGRELGGGGVGVELKGPRHVPTVFDFLITEISRRQVLLDLLKSMGLIGTPNSA